MADCSVCGAALPESAAFCPTCGTAVKAAAEEGPPAGKPGTEDAMGAVEATPPPQPPELLESDTPTAGSRRD